MHNIYIINGPNLNLLGVREPLKYGTAKLEEINDSLLNEGRKLGASLKFFQSNDEGEIINEIHRSINFDGLIINAAGYTHTSVSIRDALIAVKSTFIEVHMSNIYKREKFRHFSYLSDQALGVICGFGKESYNLALNALIKHLNIKLNKE